MNNTQKNAWIMLSAVLLSVVAAVYVGSIILLGRIPPSPLGQIVVGSVTLGGVACLALTVFFIARRQSRAEPESDERDKTIMKNAVVVSFLAGWLLLFLVFWALGLALGQTGPLPVYAVTLILLGTLVVTSVVYSVAVLAQYGRANKEANHE